MRAFFILISCLLILQYSRAANTCLIRSITIHGNHVFSERELDDVMLLRAGDRYSAKQFSHDIKSVQDIYSRNGYFFAEVTGDSSRMATDSSSIDIVLNIDEGKQVSIGILRIDSCRIFTQEEILKQFETHVGGFLQTELLETDIAGLLNRYERQGYPFVSASIPSIALYDDSTGKKLRVEISVQEGQLVSIDEIRVTGNKETDAGVIVRESRISLHELYNPDKVERIPERLNHLNIFSHVDEPQLYVNSRGGGLLINVNEGNTNAFDGIVGYAPAQSNSSGGIVTGFVNVSMRNLFGTARKLNVHWQSDERDAQELGVEYVEPWIFSLPIDLSAGFTQRQQDSSYVQRFINGRIDLLVNESLTLSGVATFENVIPSSTLAVPVVQQSRTSTAGVEIRYDTRNDIINPTSGVNYATNYQAGMKTIEGASQNSLAVSTLSVDASVYLSTGLHQVIALGFHGRERTGGSIELGDLYRLGGANSLRGYLENQFLGSRIAWENSEYRFLLARHSYFFLLFDVGYFYLPGDETKGIASTQQTKYGYGVGIRMDTSLGNIGISLAFGQGDSFTEGKLHFGLANEF